MSTEIDSVRESLVKQLVEADEEREQLRAENDQLAAEVARLNAEINTPHTVDFLESVRLEAAHQVQRWGAPHDRQKSAEHWFWLVGYLAGKALRAALTGDRTKALHHCISSAAALLHWHTAISRDESGCGQGKDADLAAIANVGNGEFQQ